MPRLWAAGAAIVVRSCRTSAVLLMLSLVLTSLTACELVIPEAEKALGLRACYEDGQSFRYSGAFDPLPDDPWIPTTNSVLLQFNDNCEDVVGYGEYVARLTDPVGGKTEISTARISFKGTRPLGTTRIDGTVYVDLDITCEGDCEGYEPYAFDYPATWWAEVAPQGEAMPGWLDGYGDFLLDEAQVIHPHEEYRSVPGLEIWPSAQLGIKRGTIRLFRMSYGRAVHVVHATGSVGWRLLPPLCAEVHHVAVHDQDPDDWRRYVADRSVAKRRGRARCERAIWFA